MKMFDYDTVARRAGIPREKLHRLEVLTRAEFPSDEMMVELHLLRSALAVERGEVTIDALLDEGGRAAS